jgi:hypothetical protein
MKVSERESRSGASWLTWIFINSLALVFAAYGIKCIFAGTGLLTEPSRMIMGSFYLARVSGRGATLTGLGYVAGGFFAYLSGIPTREQSHPMRVLRRILQGASLVAMFMLWHRAHNFRIGL